LWSISKTLRIPIDNRIQEIRDIPYTISYVIRKNQQVDSLSELSKDKRPPERLIWYGRSEDLEEWIDNAVGNKKSQNSVEFEIDEGDIG